MLPEHGFDLSRFDPEAANFNLIILAADELDVAIRKIASKVSGFIQACFGIVAEGVRDEFFSREFRTVEISPGQTVPANVQLPHDTYRDGLKVTIEEKNLSVSNGVADRDRLRSLGDALH
jgi:hypothetical protein